MTPTLPDRDAAAVRRLGDALDDLVSGIDEAAAGPPGARPLVVPGGSGPDPRPRRRTLALVAAAAVLVAGLAAVALTRSGDDGTVTAATDGATAPASTSAPTPDPGSGGDAAVRQAALDMVLPVDGVGARRMVEVTVALDRLARAECDIPGHGGMVLGHRFEEDLLPDVDDIRERGLVTPVVDETGVVSVPAADRPCYDAAIPEYQEAFEAAVTFIEGARDLRADPASAPAQAEAAACTRAALPGHDDVTGIDGVWALVDEARTLSGAELDARSRELAEVFVECSAPYYDWQREQLLARRAQVVAGHDDLIDRLATRLTAAGYQPS